MTETQINRLKGVSILITQAYHLFESNFYKNGKGLPIDDLDSMWCQNTYTRLLGIKERLDKALSSETINRGNGQ